MRSPDQLRELFEEYLGWVTRGPIDGALGDAMRYALKGGGKRIRPVLCLAVGEAAGAAPPTVVPAAAAVELVHTFSLVHDDLPALDDDDLRRGRPSTHVQFGEGVAILTGDALLTHAFHLALSYGNIDVLNELANATLNMIEGQYRDITGERRDLQTLHELKTGALFVAAAGCALHVANVPRGDEQVPYRAFAHDFGLLFQVVDDMLDGDGVVRERGPSGAHALAREVEARARACLDHIAADTSVLAELLSGLSARISGR